jgi:hypothetical protein
LNGHVRRISHQEFVDLFPSESSIKSITTHASIDGESLDTCDWMELVAPGAESSRDLEETFFPVPADHQSKISFDESSEFSEMDGFLSTDEMLGDEESSSSESEQYVQDSGIR